MINDIIEKVELHKNKLTHEYPNCEEEITEGIILSMSAFDEIESIFKKIVEYRKQKNLKL